MKFVVPAILLWGSGALAQSAAVVEGMVTDSMTHTGVAGVSVTLWTNKGSYKATTDSSGAFVISGVDPGDYNYRFEKDGYESRELPTFGQPRLRVGAAGTFHADTEIAALATLRGRVVDPEGKPAAKVKVELDFGPPADTDAEGRFEFDKVRPGNYSLRAVPSAQTSEGVQPVATYYPSTTSRGEAEHIQVRAGADLAGYEIRLRTSPVYHVRGVVFDENGNPETGAIVRLLGPAEKRLLAGILSMATGTRMYLNSTGAKQEEAATLSKKDGTFDLSVQPGDWSLQAELNPRHDTRNNLYFVSSDIVPVSVSDHDIADIELRFSPPFTLEITADWGDRPPTANLRPQVMVTPASGLLLTPARPQGDKLVVENAQPGRYRIVPSLGSKPGFYAAAIMVGGRNVLGQEVELTAATPSIQVVYRPNPGSVRGTIDQGEGATVLLWPEGPDTPEFVPAVMASAHGTFEFNSVPPGEYLLVAFDRIPPSGGTEAFVRGAVAAGTRVEVQEGGSESIQVPLTRWPD